MFRAYRVIFILLFLTCTISLAFPFYTPLGNPSEADIIRGLELLQFSPVGWVSVIAPILLWCVAFVLRSRVVKESFGVLLLLFAPVCHIHAMGEAYRELCSAVDTHVTLCPAATVYFITLVMLGLACIVNIRNTYRKGEERC